MTKIKDLSTSQITKLIKESIGEARKSKILEPVEGSTPLETVELLYQEILGNGTLKVRLFAIDDEYVDDIIFKIARKTGKTKPQWDENSAPDFRSMEDSQLQAIIPFLNAIRNEVFEGNTFERGYNGWNGRNITYR